MEVFCIHEKDKVPATQESWRRCKTERRRQEPVVFVTWSKQKSRRRDWEHFRLLFERHAPLPNWSFPFPSGILRGGREGMVGPRRPPRPACISEGGPAPYGGPLRREHETEQASRCARRRVVGQEGEGRGGGHDACPPPPHFLPVDIACAAFTAGGTEPPPPRAGFLHAAGPGPGLCDPPPPPVAWGPPV